MIWMAAMKNAPCSRKATASATWVATRNRATCTALGANSIARDEPSAITKTAPKTTSSSVTRSLPAAGQALLGRQLHAGLPVTHDRRVDDELVLGVDELLARRARDLVLGGHEEGLRGARLDAQAAEDAPQIVDLIDLRVALARREANSGGVLCSHHVDGVGRAGSGAQLAADALLQAVGMTVEDVTTLEARKRLSAHLRVPHGLLATEDVSYDDPHAGHDLRQRHAVASSAVRWPHEAGGPRAGATRPRPRTARRTLPGARRATAPRCSRPPRT